MAEGLNKVMLLGNLGADPDLRFTQGGQAVLNIRLATTETYLDKEKVRQERTDWHSVVIWGKRGEALAKILGKGSSIFIEGSIRTSSYDDRDGNKRYKTEVIASNVLLTGRGRGGDEGGAARGDTAGAGPEDERGGGAGRGGGGYGRGAPRSQGAGRAGNGGARPAARPQGGHDEPETDNGNDAGDYGGGGGDDDIPF